MAEQSHYPHYDVMDEAEAWDDHTRDVVRKRLAPNGNFSFLTNQEAKTLAKIVATLTDDERSEIISYILSYIDQRLQSKIGESERKVGIPKEADLIRNGLALIDTVAKSSAGQEFASLTLQERQTILGNLERQQLPVPWPDKGFPQKELFNKLLRLAVESYYSHPLVWSEIGHGGPAYPRGYVRTEPGLLDPWEAKAEE